MTEEPQPPDSGGQTQVDGRPSVGFAPNQTYVKACRAARLGLPHKLAIYDAYLGQSFEGELRRDAKAQGARWGETFVSECAAAGATDTRLILTPPRTRDKRVFNGPLGLDSDVLEAAGEAGFRVVYPHPLRRESFESKAARISEARDESKSSLHGIKVGMAINMDLKRSSEKVAKDAFVSDDIHHLQFLARSANAFERTTKLVQEARKQGNTQDIIITDAPLAIGSDKVSTGFLGLLKGADAVVPKMNRGIPLKDKTKVRPASIRAAEIALYVQGKARFIENAQRGKGFEMAPEMGDVATLDHVVDEAHLSAARAAAGRALMWDHWRDVAHLNQVGLPAFLEEVPLLKKYL